MFARPGGTTIGISYLAAPPLVLALPGVGPKKVVVGTLGLTILASLISPPFCAKLSPAVAEPVMSTEYVGLNPLQPFRLQDVYLK